MGSEKSTIQAQEELLLAKQSRLEGNEGRARVCARRAAGTAVKYYLGKIGLVSPTDNVLQSLDIFRERTTLPDRIEAAVGWLIHRVDDNFNFPEDIDLIHEAKLVLDYLDLIDPEVSEEAQS